jgi:hypothetical protein
MTKQEKELLKQRQAQNAALHKDVLNLDEENLSWLVGCLLDIKWDVKALDVRSALTRIEELLETVAHD